jgi:hypothetical protein
MVGRQPGSGPAAAGSQDVYDVPNLAVLSERRVNPGSTRSRHPSAGMATGR